jgi:hypothetical protein
LLRICHSRVPARVRRASHHAQALPPGPLRTSDTTSAVVRDVVNLSTVAWCSARSSRSYQATR